MKERPWDVQNVETAQDRAARRLFASIARIATYKEHQPKLTIRKATDAPFRKAGNSTGVSQVSTENDPCEFPACSHTAEATLDARLLCRSHFYDTSTKRLDEHQENLQRSELTGIRAAATLKSLSEIISQTTILVVRAKLLSPWQQVQLRELSVRALALYKRVQRDSRLELNAPILLYREDGSQETRELTNTINISKRGACVATRNSRTLGEKIWIQKPAKPLRALARVAWVRQTDPARFSIGLEILDQANYWETELSSRLRAK